jgi:hypothetical protein
LSLIPLLTGLLLLLLLLLLLILLCLKRPLEQNYVNCFVPGPTRVPL